MLLRIQWLRGRAQCAEGRGRHTSEGTGHLVGIRSWACATQDQTLPPQGN